MFYTGWAIINLPELVRTLYLQLKDTFEKKDQNTEDDVHAIERQ